MYRALEQIERRQLRKVPGFSPGDRVRVHFRVIEGQRRRTQLFEGTVIRRQGTGARETFTIRKHSFGVGVERTFPLHSPKIEKIDVAARGEVRRAKLYYLRERVGKRARVREARYTGEEAGPPVETLAEGAGTAAADADRVEQASGERGVSAEGAAAEAAPAGGEEEKGEETSNLQEEGQGAS